MLKKLLHIFCVIVVCLGLTGCGPEVSSSAYDPSELRQTTRAYPGVVLQVDQAVVKREDTTAGTAIGAIGLGALANQTIGGGKGKALATAAGALGGGLLGSKVQGRKKAALTYTVELDTGEVVVVTQGPTPLLQEGDLVYYFDGGSTGRPRVTLRRN